jgi:hypothetical protein
MLNNYFATQCSGTGGQIVDLSLLTGGTDTVFLGSDGLCWNVLPSQTSSAATVIPLLEFGLNIDGGCTNCITNGCVYWEVTADSGGADITLEGCCGDSGTTTFNLSSDAVINVCSKTQPVVVSGSANSVNLGVCPSC